MLASLGATDSDIVNTWLQEEQEYLHGLLKEPAEETLEMEYYKMLTDLHTSEWVSHGLFFKYPYASV